MEEIESVGVMNAEVEVDEINVEEEEVVEEMIEEVIEIGNVQSFYSPEKIVSI